MLYCALHGFEHEPYTFDPAVTVRWAVPRWGAWPLLLPGCYWLIQRALHRSTLAVGLGSAAMAAVFGASAFAYGAQLLLGRAPSVFEVAFHVTPQATATFALAVAAGFWLWGRADAAEAVGLADDAQNAGIVLQVSKGQLQTNIESGQIEWVRAAGNYVELFVGDGTSYLKRSSMADLERQLPAGEFARVHCSHLVRTSRIVGLKGGKSRPVLVTASGATVAVGKSYRQSVFDLVRGISGST